MALWSKHRSEKERIKSIDTRAAETAPGVALVLTHRNAPAQGTGNHREAHPVLTGPQVTGYGQPVAFVVAESFEQARAAAYLVDVKYERSSGKYALRSNLKQARVPTPSDAPAADSAVGNFASAFAGAPVQLDVTYTTPLQSHAMMEPHATLAMWDGDKLTLHTANQMLNQGQQVIATTLKIPVENIRLISPFIGGGFGGKLWVNADAILAAIASRQLKRPVKIALTRQQIFHVTTHRSTQSSAFVWAPIVMAAFWRSATMYSPAICPASKPMRALPSRPVRSMPDPIG